MQPATQKMLDQLAHADWFANVGNLELDKIRHASNWAEAIQVSESIEAENVRLDAQGNLTVYLCQYAKERDRLWNDLVRGLKTIIIPLVTLKTGPVQKANNLPKGFVDTVQWDILAICMEIEYADLVPPTFYAQLAKWYLRGHFPCGWEGEYPQGMLIVY